MDVLSFNQYVNELNDFHFPGKEKLISLFNIRINFGALDVGKFIQVLDMHQQKEQGENMKTL